MWLHEFHLQMYRSSLDSDQGEQGLKQTSEYSEHLPVSCSKITAEEIDVPWGQLQQSQ